jgi:hypothetical protein
MSLFKDAYKHLSKSNNFNAHVKTDETLIKLVKETDNIEWIHIEEYLIDKQSPIEQLKSEDRIIVDKFVENWWNVNKTSVN